MKQQTSWLGKIRQSYSLELAVLVASSNHKLERPSTNAYVINAGNSEKDKENQAR